MTHEAEPWRQIVARLFTLIRPTLHPHDPPRIPANTKWAIDQTWLAIERGEILSVEGYLKLGNVASGLNDIPRALRAYTLARTGKPESTIDDSRKYLCSLAALNAGQILFQQGDAAEAYVHIRVAVNELSTENSAQSQIEIADALLLQGMIEKRLGMTQEAHDSFTRALIVSREHTLPSAEARCWVQFAHLDYADGQLLPAQEKIRKALDLLAVAGDHRELVRTYYNAALLSADAGEITTAREQVDRALELMSTQQIEYGNGKVERLRDELNSALRGQEV